MIHDVVGNLLETDKCTVIVHQTNLYHTFGAGIAKAIREKFPEAYEADCKTKNGDENKLGTYSSAKITDCQGTSIEYIVNLYSQYGIGGQDRNTSYDKMVDGLTLLRNRLQDLSLKRMTKGQPKLTLGIPFQLGCGLANGRWTVVRAIIEDTFKDSSVDVYIYTLPELAAKK